jgi:hypothetical protein
MYGEEMIYQQSDKEKAAVHNGLSPDAYYHLPYKEWAKIREQWVSQFPTGI